MGIGKRELRVESLRARGLLSPDQLAAADAALARAVVPLVTGSVAAYVSRGTEPGTRALLAALPEVLLPVLLPDGDLDWARDDGHRRAGPRGLTEPAGPRLGRDAVADCALVLVPALAVDLTGARLGRGGGSYDRALSRTRGLVLAALHVGELRDCLATEPHDLPVHGVVLPDRGVVVLRHHRPGEMGR